MALRSHAIATIVNAICTVLVALFVAACHAETKSPYPVTSSGLLFGGGNLGTNTPIYWLDNDRVLFPGYGLLHHKRADGKDEISSTPPGIYIWDTKSGEYKRHADLERPMWFLCFNQGFIAYSTPDSPQDSDGDPYAYKRKVITSGMLGHEKEQARTNPWVYPEQCDSWPRLDKDLLHPLARVYYLRPEDGRILVGEPSMYGPQDEQVKLYRPGQADPIALPILAKEMYSSAKLTFSKYAGKYVLIPNTWRGRDMTSPVETWPSDVPEPIYLISPDGKVETFNIPPRYGSSMGAFPTRQGLFRISNDAPSGNSKQAGGWLLRDGKMIKLFDHLVNGAGVSPDGCKIAYASDSHTFESLVMVQMINVCQKTGEK